eukprot:CAMPEP_0176423788 /NCGR_PEP_ID=MMETSP0127-20121128/10479_1 /TAXON_ID=938130 /ORGANISM="Platyophrya macrostoma, Strain WH" /LENGTH=114 /DNA_ID=CAMNT_0017804779 /DNA_START=287 /DNA_END=631 /DNA_ORIENTATION=-
MKRQNLKKRELFLERENKKNWKPRKLRWSIEKAESKAYAELLVLSEDNEIQLNFNDSDDEYNADVSAVSRPSNFNRPSNASRASYASRPSHVSRPSNSSVPNSQYGTIQSPKSP